MSIELKEGIKRWFGLCPANDITFDDARVLINRKYTRNRGLFFEHFGPLMLDELIKLEDCTQVKDLREELDQADEDHFDECVRIQADKIKINKRLS